MKPILRYDHSGTVHEEPATVDAAETALSLLDNAERTSITVVVREEDGHETSFSVHGCVTGPLVCSWVRLAPNDVEFERWLLGPNAAEDRTKVLVWGADTRLPARYVVSADAVRLRLKSCLEGEDLARHGPWEDAL